MTVRVVAREIYEKAPNAFFKELGLGAIARVLGGILPGVYLPDRGGVRIEDTLAVTGDSPELLTRFSKDLVVL